MFKNSCLTLLLLCFFCCCRAAASSPSDENFTKILVQENKEVQKQLLVKYIRKYYRTKSVDSLLQRKTDMKNLFALYKLESRAAFNYFLEYFFELRSGRFGAAETALFKSIEFATKNGDEYLLYVFYTELGFLQSDIGNTAQAVYSYSMARKQAMVLDDATHQATIDVNLSDIFYRNGYYNQSLFYLKHALYLVTHKPVTEQTLINTIYNNTADNYFKLGKADSVRKYNNLLRTTPDGVYNKYIFIKLTDYHLAFMRDDFKEAIKQIVALKTDSQYQYSHHDEQILADAYFKAGINDSAKAVIARLLVDKGLQNHPEVKYHLYDMLGHIARHENDVETAAINFELGLQQAQEHIGRLTQVDNISSKLKTDEVESAFAQKENGYKRERQGLIYVLIITLLTIAVIAMIFSATRQKRYYERLVYNTRKKELSFINSHEVRRHLSNLLGLIDVIRASDNKHEQYLEAEPMILQEAESLDGAIKTISEKLESDVELSKPVKHSHSGLV